ncbi:MAG: phosphoribosylamine--glycine ligase [Deltaproteobacteria bacterium]|nr:phosphoribosylamine--glycine ligase [Deltaproteobacteria bacterium]
MKILIIGSGGREHAIAWKLSQSKRVKKLFIAPGNPGTASLGENCAIPAEDVEGLKAFALKEKIDLTVVGPEFPLTLGITDAFTGAGLPVFGPAKAASEIESSKVFAKVLMKRYKIPTGFHKTFEDAADAIDYVDTHKPPYVIKADGLAAGKGVYVCPAPDEARSAVNLIMRKKAFGMAGRRIIIEEFLSGEEASFLALTDGKAVVPLAPAQDHKTVFDGDKGPNTGGMGAYSPAPVITPSLEAEIMETIMRPTVAAMEQEGRPYKGVLYAGIMVSGGRPKVLEFNARFGDPETQPLMMRLEDDLAELLLATVEGRLADVKPRWSPKASVCVVMASEGYPGTYPIGNPIRGLGEAAKLKDVAVFHAGTSMRGGRVVTSGGRVLGVTALGGDIKDAIAKAYSAVEQISFDGAHYRRDIGKKAVKAG